MVKVGIPKKLRFASRKEERKRPSQRLGDEHIWDSCTAEALWWGHRGRVVGIASRLVKLKWGERQEITTERPVGQIIGAKARF